MAVYTPIEAQPAPENTKGVVHWLRENLFSNAINTIFTLFGFYLIYLPLPPLLDWLIFDATWSGSKEKIVNGGTRWIFITEKFDQFIYGFYPKELHWRPNTVIFLAIALGLTFKYVKDNKVKIAAVVLFPVISFFLLHGGMGLEVVETEKWGGLMLTIIVASVGIIASFPIGIVLALGLQ